MMHSGLCPTAPPTARADDAERAQRSRYIAGGGDLRSGGPRVVEALDAGLDLRAERLDDAGGQLVNAGERAAAEERKQLAKAQRGPVVESQPDCRFSAGRVNVSFLRKHERSVFHPARLSFDANVTDEHTSD